MRGLRWPGGRRPARSLGELLRPQSMVAMRRRFPIADCDHGEARWSRKMDECEGRISARELVARRCWASVRSSASAAGGLTGPSDSVVLITCRSSVRRRRTAVSPSCQLELPTSYCPPACSEAVASETPRSAGCDDPKRPMVTYPCRQELPTAVTFHLQTADIRLCWFKGMPIASSVSGYPLEYQCQNSTFSSQAPPNSLGSHLKLQTPLAGLDMCLSDGGRHLIRPHTISKP